MTAMNRLMLAGFLALLALPTVAHADDIRIGYFDIKRIIQEVDEANDKRKTLESDVKEKQKQLDKMKAEVEDMQKEYEAKKSVLSPSAQREQEEKIQEKAVKAQQTYMDLQQDLARKEQEAMGDLLQKLEPVVQEIAQADGYTFIFEKNEAGLFYAPAAHDLTSELIRKYNQRFPGKGKSSSAKPK